MKNWQRKKKGLEEINQMKSSDDIEDKSLTELMFTCLLSEFAKIFTVSANSINASMEEKLSLQIDLWARRMCLT